MTLLIADDSELLRLSLKKLLEPVCFITKIFEAQDPLAAIEMITQYYPDAIILDLGFQQGSGFDVMDFLVQQDLEMLVIVLTNFYTAHNRQKSYSRGAHFFFDKSHDYEKLEDVIKNYD